jgi:hypothetical protein
VKHAKRQNEEGESYAHQEKEKGEYLKSVTELFIIFFIPEVYLEAHY